MQFYREARQYIHGGHYYPANIVRIFDTCKVFSKIVPDRED